MKPITYWVQNAAVNRLVKQYGERLEKLSDTDKRLLLMGLEMMALCRANADFANFVAREKAGIPSSFEVGRAIAIISSPKPTDQQLDLLIEAIAVTLSGSAKEGTPTAGNAL